MCTLLVVTRGGCGRSQREQGHLSVATIIKVALSFALLRFLRYEMLQCLTYTVEMTTPKQPISHIHFRSRPQLCELQLRTLPAPFSITSVAVDGSKRDDEQS